MGVVYEAEQKNPRRRVALKVVRGGQFIDDVSVKLFQREAETLGRLKHPGIGAIYESGRTEDGQHFFAMELVRGETLDEHVRKRGELTRGELHERLELFCRICDAVNYAHQRGVIHRDLKPSNIVIGEDGEPKVLDFGLARITDTDAAAVTLMTEAGVIRGTLAYMSPEQASGNPAEIDLRTDVYSLGILLYELLSGQRPYDTGSGSMVDAIRTIADVDPAPFRRTGAAAKLAGGDLETIVRKALEKSPDRRYQSAAALSDDIERYLTNQPILARPPSTIYQLRKLLARHKLPFAFASSLLALLIGFGIWMGLLYARTEAARQESEAVTGFLSDMLAAVKPEEEGRDVTVRQILDKAAGTIESEFPDQVQVRQRLMRTMGVAYSHLGVYAESESLLTKTVASVEAEHGPESADLLPPLENLAVLLSRAGQYDRAEECYDRILAIQERVFGGDDPDFTGTLNNLAVLYWKKGEFARAREVYERILALKSRTLDPDDPSFVAPLNNLGILYQRSGETEKAKASYERALRIKEAEVGPDHPAVASILNGLGVLAWTSGDPEGARPYLERALAIREKALGPDHPETALSLNNLGILHRGEGRLELANEYFSRALTIREKTLGPDHPEVAGTYRAIGNLKKELGRLEEAESDLERALAILERPVGRDHPDHAGTAFDLALVYEKEGRNADARALIDHALEVQRTVLGPKSPELVDGLEQSAALHRKEGRLDLAEEEEALVARIRESKEN